MEVKLEDDGGSPPMVATTQDVGSVDKAVRNTPAKDKAGLISADEIRDMGLQSGS